VLRKCQSVRCAQVDGTTLRRAKGSAPGQQRSRAGHPAHRKALCVDGREPSTTAFQCAKVSGISQLARHWCAMPSPHATARLRIVLEGYVWQLWHSPATATRFAFT
jgi:hypothetical protein